MPTTSFLINKWKLKYVLPSNTWIPQFGRPDILVFGKCSSQRLQAAKKLVSGFKDEFDNAYIYEVGFHGKLVATYDKDLKKFILEK